MLLANYQPAEGANLPV